MTDPTTHPGTGQSRKRKYLESFVKPANSLSSSTYKQYDMVKVKWNGEYLFGWYCEYLDWKHSNVWFERKQSTLWTASKWYNYYRLTQVKNKCILSPSKIFRCLYL